MDFFEFNPISNYSFGTGATYSFTISSNSVTAMSETNGNWTFNIPLKSNSSFSVSNSSGAQIITQTITGSFENETIVYSAQSSNPKAYSIVSETTTINTPTTNYSNGMTEGITFNSSNGVITSLSYTRTFNTNTNTSGPVTISDAVFTKNADNSVTEVTIAGNQIQTSKYVQPAGGTLYALSSITSTFIQAGSATTILNVEPNDQLTLSFTGNNVTGVQSVGFNGTKTTLTIPSNVTFQEVQSGSAQFVEELITHNNATSYALYLESGNSLNYTEIAHGSGSTIDLVGVQAQLKQIPASIVSLL